MLERDLDGLLADLFSGDDLRAETAAEALQYFGARAISKLKPYLASPEAETRWWAARALAEISDPEVPQLLVNLLDDPEPAVRQCVALGLRQQASEVAVVPLTKALGDEDPLVRRLAGDALVSLGEAAVPALVEQLASGKPGAQLEATRALALIGDTRAVPALYQIWENGSTMMQYWAEEGLQRMGIGMVFFKPE